MNRTILASYLLNYLETILNLPESHINNSLIDCIVFVMQTDPEAGVNNGTND